MRSAGTKELFVVIVNVFYPRLRDGSAFWVSQVGRGSRYVAFFPVPEADRPATAACPRNAESERERSRLAEGGREQGPELHHLWINGRV